MAHLPSGLLVFLTKSARNRFRYLAIVRLFELDNLPQHAIQAHPKSVIPFPCLKRARQIADTGRHLP